MKNVLTALLFFLSSIIFAQSNTIQAYKLKEDFGKIIQDLSDNYIYLKDKKTDFDCVKEKYSGVIDMVKTRKQKMLFFEYLLDEFYDSNLRLDIETELSYRLHSPVYVTLKNNKFFIKNIWFSQMDNFGKNILDAEVLRFNNQEFNKLIDNFPTQCANKNIPEVREWIANKIISGRLSENRILTLKLADDRKLFLDVDKIKIKKEIELLSVSIKNDIAVVKINNSLGNDNLIKYFDRILNSLMDTKGLILDLRNTLQGENSYVARAIMSRFINKELPYQKHVSQEKRGDNPEIKKNWLENVSPRGEQYKKSMVVLVGKWTGNIGESLAIGLDGMKRAKIIGTEMGKKAGITAGYSFKNSSYGYRIPIDKLYHLNGQLREDFVPEYSLTQKSVLEDDILFKAFNLLEFDIDDNFNMEGKSKNSIALKIDK